MFLRRQTLYLLILIAVFVAILVMPVAVFMDINTGKEILISVHHFFITQILSFLLLILAVTTLLMFKKRTLQGRITVFMMIVCVALQIILPILLHLSSTETMSVRYEIVFVTPIIAALLAYLTFRRITRDEIIEKIIEFKKFDNSKN